MTWYKAQEVNNKGGFTYHIMMGDSHITKTNDVINVCNSIAGAWEATWLRSRHRSWRLLWMGCSATQLNTGLGSVTSHKKVG